MRGAHLMVPGVLNWPCGIEAGSMAAVVIDGSPYPVAVGVCESSVDERGNVRTTGRALEVLHYFGDGLWKLTSKPFPSGEALSEEAIGDQDVSASPSEPGTTDVGDASGRPSGCHEATAGDVPKGDSGAPVASSETAGTVETNEEPAGTTEPGEVQHLAEAGHEQNGGGGNGGSIAAVVEGVETLEISAPAASGGAKPASVVFPVPLVDHVIRVCFLQTIHGIADTQLPMEVSALYGQMTADGARLLATPAFRRLLKEAGMWDDNISPENAAALVSYKNSSCKKLAKLFQAWAKEGLITVKETRGTATVVNINRGSEAFVKFQPIALAQVKEREGPRSDKVKVKRLLAFSAAQRKDLAARGLAVDKEPLPLEKFKQFVAEHVSNDGDVIMQYVNDATQYHQVLRGEDASPVRKGPAQPVTVAVEPRGNRKHITTVKGLFNYLFNVDESAVAEALRRKFASSVSVSNGVVTIQGKVPIKNELVDQFGLSQQHVKLL
ncbi:translation initiation factor sui1 protein [Babesia caballi]|uniref:Translation initiation factor sui1 protein n=1 Tax=Babesia caballi TaxID=5871 RepID=A0AAV4LSN4_BABCB|nr:translation initiation factor sui1 protein [Babesia caballi]